MWFAPRTFVELIEREVPVYWRTQSARGPVCTKWTPRHAGAQRTLSASVTIRCVESTASVHVNVRSDDVIELDGVGGAVAGRTGGSGWMRTASGRGLSVQWIESDEQRVLTSEGPWFFDASSCEASSAALASAAVALQSTRAPHENIRSASDLLELRWSIASYRSSGPPEAIVAAITTLFRPGATLWEPSPGGRACRRWTVEQDRTHHAVLTRELRATRGTTIVERQPVAWDEACGEFELAGCARLHRGPGVGGGEHSSYEGRVTIDSASDEGLSVGQLRVFASRDACMGSSARRFGPLFRACDP